MKQEARRHAKIILAAKDMGVDRCVLLGIIGEIWAETAARFPAGDIGRATNEEIAVYIDYSGDINALVEVLLKRRLLDVMEGDARLYVHDWHDHCEDWVRHRLQVAKKTFANGAPPRKTQRTAAKPGQPPTYDENCREVTKGDDLPRAHDLSHKPKPEPEPEGERASAPPPPPAELPPLDPYLAAERLYHGEFADVLFNFHGGTPQGKLQIAYIEFLADWGRRGIVPTAAQLGDAVDEACAYWRREQKSGRCVAAGPVLKALTEIVNPLTAGPPGESHLPPLVPEFTPEEIAATKKRRRETFDRQMVEFGIRQPNQGAAVH